MNFTEISLKLKTLARLQFLNVLYDVLMKQNGMRVIHNPLNLIEKTRGDNALHH